MTAQTDTERALIKAIVDDPEDDTVRLVYADYLDERDEPDHDRARFIRLQIELALSERDEQRWSLSERHAFLVKATNELLRVNRDRWVKVPCRVCDETGTDRNSHVAVHVCHACAWTGDSGQLTWRDTWNEALSRDRRYVRGVRFTRGFLSTVEGFHLHALTEIKKVNRKLVQYPTARFVDLLNAHPLLEYVYTIDFNSTYGIRTPLAKALVDDARKLIAAKDPRLPI